MKTHLWAASSALVILAGPVAAQNFGITHDGSTVSLSYNFHNDAFDQPYSENYTSFVTARSDYLIVGNFGVGVSLGYVMEQYVGDFLSDRIIYGLHPYYKIDGGRIGAYIAGEQHRTNEETYTSFGLEGTYRIGQFAFDGYFGRTDFSSTSYRTNLGLAAGYEVIDGATAYLIHRRDIDETGAFFFALTGLGVDYDFSGIGSFPPVVLSAEVSRFHNELDSVGASEWNQFSIMATYSIGGGQKDRFSGIRAVDYFYD